MKQEEEWTFVTHKRKNAKRGRQSHTNIHKTQKQIAKAKQLAETLCHDSHDQEKETNTSYSPQDVHHLWSCVEHCMNELMRLEESMFDFSILMKSLLKASSNGTISDVVCYGIGTFSTSASSSTKVSIPNESKGSAVGSDFGMKMPHLINITSPSNFYSASMIQLSCILLIRKEVARRRRQQLNNSPQGEGEREVTPTLPYSKQQELVPMVYYEPYLKPIERDVLTQYFYVTILTTNERGKRCVDQTKQNISGVENNKASIGDMSQQPTSSSLFYMPHCPMRLYSNVLWANWDPEYIMNGRLIIFGNSLLAYDDRIMDSERRNDDTNAIFPCLKWIREEPAFVKSTRKMDRNNTLSDLKLEMAFNDCVITHFMKETSEDITNKIWPLRPKEYISGCNNENFDEEVV